MSKPSRLRVGLVGTGEMARFYAHVLVTHVPDVELVAVSSQDESRAASLAESFGIPRAVGRHDLVFDADLDAVVIASASDTHAALIHRGADAGVPMLCDKPLGIALPEIDAAIAAAEARGIVLATGFNRRFDPAFDRLRAAVSDGSLGRPEALLLISRDPGMPTRAELATPHRLFIGTSIHDLDMARYMVGDEVVALTAHGAWLADESPATEQVDSAVITLRFRRGAVATIINSWRSHDGYDQRVECHGSRGSMRVGNVEETMADVPREAAFFVQRYAASYVEEIRAFVETARDATWHPALATALDGRHASALAEAAITSWRDGRTVEPTD